MKKNCIIFFLLLLCSSNKLEAKDFQKIIDSLKVVLKTGTSAEETGQAYYDICYGFYRLEQHDSVLVYANKGIELAKKHDLKFLEALILEEKALSLEFLDIDQSIKVYLQALSAYDRAGKSDYIDEVKFEGVGNAHTILIRMYARRGEMDKALHHYNIIESIVKEKQYHTRKAIFESMGFAQAFSEDYQEAIKYFKSSIQLGKEAEKSTGEITRGMEENHALIGSYYFKLNQVDSALHYLQLARAITTQEDRWRIRGKAMVMRLSGEVYMGLNQLDVARGYLELALNSYETIRDTAEISRTSANLVDCFLKQGNHQEALSLAQNAYQSAKISNDLSSIQQSLKGLMNAHIANKQEGEALTASLELLAVNDSLQSRQNLTLTEEFAKRYESKEKQVQIDLQVARIGQQRTLIWAGGLMTVLLMGLAFSIYRTAQQRRRTNKILSEQTVQLKQLDITKSRFFANISHELRTPLSLISGPLENALQKVKQKSLEKDLQLAHNNSQKLLELVNEIMDLSKLEAGKLVLTKSSIALYPFVNRVFSSYESLANLRRINWIVHNQLPKDLWIKTDLKKLDKILNNLLSNALKYTPAHGRVQLSVFENNRLISFEVADNGLGIHQDDLPKIFERFYQAEKSEQTLQGGTGIGLALAFELSKLLNGSLTVKSELGKGSTFKLQIPLEKTPATKVALPHLSPLSSLSATKIPSNYSSQLLNPNPIKILIVEDHPDMGPYLHQLLSQDYNCTLVTDGQQALNILKKQTFDLITSDVMMPNMDGFELRKAINQQADLRQTPFIMLTARALETDRLTGFQLGVDDYITKPFSTLELKARIQNLLNNKYERTAFLKTQKAEIALPLETTHQQFLKKAEQIVLNNLDNLNFTAGALATALNYSQRQCTRVIKAATGLTTVSFIREVRLQKAYHLLQDQQVSTVSEAAYQVGFENLSYFTLKFSERFGRKPSELL